MKPEILKPILENKVKILFEQIEKNLQEMNGDNKNLQELVIKNCEYVGEIVGYQFVIDNL
ncbi:MAG: hypothetical protein FWG63_01895 [Defluviitaleaceae bacterium]|nr:hypothetical protein [Defluviitaleaceae bacterium]